MSDFEFNTDAFDTAIREYTESKEKFTSIKTTLSARLNDLKSKDWKSSAGEKFFQKYEDDWSENVGKYVATIEYMINNLEKVKNSFEGLADEAKKLQYHR